MITRYAIKNLKCSNGVAYEIVTRNVNAKNKQEKGDNRI